MIEEIKKKFNNNPAILFFLVISYVISRLLVLKSGTFMWNDEELYNGTIARDIIHGLVIPFFDYMYTPHNGGTLVVGVLAVPFFKLFGETYFSLKLTAVFISTMGLIFFYTVISRHIGKGVALLSSILYIVSPSLFTKSTLMAFGIHAETICFTWAIYLILLESLRSKTKKYEIVFPVLLGAVSGFTLFFGYISFYSIAYAFLIFLIFNRKRNFLKKSFFYFVSFAAGFSPWIYYNLTHELKSLDIVKKYAFGSTNYSHLSFLDKAYKYFTIDLTVLFDSYTPGTDGISLTQFVFCHTFIVSFILIFIVNRDSLLKLAKSLNPFLKEEIKPESIKKEILLLTGAIIFSLVFLASKATVSNHPGDEYLGFRYLSHMYPYIFLTIGIFLFRLFSAPSTIYKFVSAAFLTLFLLTGVHANRHIANQSDPEKYSVQDGFSYARLGWAISKKYNFDFNKYISIGKRIAPYYQHDYYFGIGMYIAGKGLLWKKGDFEPYIGFYDYIDKNMDFESQSYFYEGSSSQLSLNASFNLYLNVINNINKFPVNFQRIAFIGMAKSLDSNKNPYTDIKNIINEIPEKYKIFFFPLLGERIFSGHLLIDRFVEQVEKLPYKRPQKKIIYSGIGASIFRIVSCNTNQYYSEINGIVPEWAESDLLEALGIQLFLKHKTELNLILQEIGFMKEEDKISILRGVGIKMGETYGFYIPYLNDLVHSFGKDSNAKYVMEGIGKAIALRYGNNDEVAKNLIKKYKSGYYPSITKGYSNATPQYGSL